MAVLAKANVILHNFNENHNALLDIFNDIKLRTDIFSNDPNATKEENQITSRAYNIACLDAIGELHLDTARKLNKLNLTSAQEENLTSLIEEGWKHKMEGIELMYVLDLSELNHKFHRAHGPAEKLTVLHKIKELIETIEKLRVDEIDANADIITDPNYRLGENLKTTKLEVEEGIKKQVESLM